MVVNSFYPFLASYQYVHAEDVVVAEESVSSSEEASASEEGASSEESSGTEESAPAEESVEAPAEVSTETQPEEGTTDTSASAAEITSDPSTATTDETQQGDILPDGVSDYRPEGSADSAPATEAVTDTTDAIDPVVEVIEPVTEEATAEEIEKECSADGADITDYVKEDWELDEESGYYVTKEDVKLGVKYIFPDEEKVTVTFSCLPKDESYRSELRIQQVALDDLILPDDISTSAQYAFDITTDMKEGTFEYDITLPKPEGVEAEVSYIEGEIKDIAKKEITEEDVVEVSVEDIDQKKDEGEIAVQDLGHFTIFVVVNPNTQGKCNSVQIGTTPDSTCFLTIQEAVNAAFDGDTIYIAPGTYDENVTINKRLILQGAGNDDNPNTNTIITSSVANTAVITINASGLSDSERLHIKDVRVAGTGSDANGIYIVGGGDYITFENVAAVNNNNHGIEASFSGAMEDLEIINSNLSENTKVGFRTSSSTGIKGLTITDTIANHNMAGLYFNGPVTGVVLTGGSYDDNHNNVAIDPSLTSGLGIYSIRFNDLVDGERLPSSLSDFTANDNVRGVVLNKFYGAFSITNATVNNNLQEGIAMAPGANVSGLLFENIEASNNPKWNFWLISYLGFTVSDVTIRNSTFNGSTGTTGFEGTGLYLYSSTNSTLSDVDVSECTMDGNRTGLYMRTVSATSIDDIVVRDSSFTNNTEYGAFNNDSAERDIDLRLNWWGSATGPAGVAGGSGDAVGSNILYQEWLCESPLTSWISEEGVCSSDEPDSNKVTLCHAAGQAGTTKFTTLTISYNAAFGRAGHFYEDGTPRAGHEDDYLGACVPEDLCGNNVIDNGEQCDDGNLTNGDGCSATCTTETRCGDGNVNSQAEECDDGNQNDSDYCSNACEFNSVCLTDGTNMIVNGDFETPVVANALLWDIFNMYSPMLGWNVVWNGGNAIYNQQTRPEPANLELHRGVTGWVPASGSQYAELDTDWDGPGNPLNDEPATVGISQEVPVLDGYKYKVEFSYSPRPGTDASNNVMDFDWDGTTVDTYSGAGGGNTSWIAKSYDFVADETGITNVAFVEQGTADSLGMFLDDVNVTCLGPEVLPVCGDGVVNQTTEECDGTTGVTNGTNFCTSACKLISIYDGEHICPQGTVRSETPIISTSVSSTDSDGQTISLGGGTYLFEAIGDYGYGGDIPNNTINRADAGYATGDAWATRRDDLLGFPSTAQYRGITSLLSDMGTGTIGLVDWGEYNSDHIYSKVYNTSGNVQFLISDWYDTWYSGDQASDTNKDQGGMRDNAGSIALNVYTCDAISCGNGRQEPGEECDGTSGVTPSENFCTYDCKLAPIYDGAHECSEGKYPVAYSGPFTISSTDIDGITVPVVGGKEYLIEASGTFIPTGAPGYLSDAGYTLVNGSVSNLYGIKGTPPDYAAHALLGNFGGGVGVIDWGDYNSDHRYRKAYSFGNNTDINFLIGDRYDNWFDTDYNNQIGMDDNKGDLSLTVYECATPVCGNGRLEFGEECDGTDGVKADENFCTSTCQLIPLYDGNHTCAPGTAPVKVGDTYNIDSKDFDGVSVPLIGGQQYLFKVFGTYNFGGSALNRVADAAYGSENFWASARPDLGIWGTPNRGVLSVLGNLGTGVGVIEWDNDSIFDEDHAYEKAFTPANDISAQFLISDWYSDWYENICKNQKCRDDNTGVLSLEVYECRPSSDVTICKYDSGGQSLSGWNVALKGDLMDTVNVLPNGSDYDSIDLPTGDYVLEASGYYTYRPGTAGAEYTDANYSKRHPSDAVYGGPYVPWVNVNTFPAPHTGWLGVMINDNATNWSDYYASDHTYLLGFEDYTGTFSFKMLDDAYGDNSGSIPVKIYEGYAGTTRENGCVIFNDVPMGTYVVDEILKDGWVNLDNTRGATVQVDGEDDRFALVNDDFSEVGLYITKTNFGWPTQLHTGGIVTYQLTLEAVGGSLDDVHLVDLPPAGFIPGNFQASGIEPPTYASPGVWDIGSMEENEIITLTYDAVIQPEVDPGIYPDLAWAYGKNTAGQPVTASSKSSEFAINNGIVDDTFVGTQIEVVENGPSVKTEVDEETEEEEVLGASITRLPATGASTVVLITVLVIMLIGTLLIALSRKKKFLLALPVFLLAALLVPGSAYAITPDPDLVVRLEKPANFFNEPFEITFVAMDTKGGRDLTVTCYMDGPSSGAHSYDTVLPADLKQGGDTDKCEVEGADLEGNGTYQFWAELSAAGGGGAVTSGVPVTTSYDNDAPDKPKYIEVDRKSDCKYEIELKTANDGQTAYVEVYMSDDKEFTAGPGSRIRTIDPLGPDEKYTFTEEVAGEDCGHRQYFAVRAFDLAGNGSDVEAEEITHTEYKTIYKDETEEIVQAAYAGEGATGIGGPIPGEGAEVILPGEEPTESEEGSILGEQVEGEPGAEKGLFGKLISSPWTWIVLILALGTITINGIRKSKKD